MTSNQLIITVEKANRIFQEIKGRHIGLHGHLVFVSQFGQCKMTSDLLKILKYFPQMVHQSAYKDKALAIIEKLETGKLHIQEGATTNKIAQEWENAMTELMHIMDMLTVKDDTFIGINLRKSNPALISGLQHDELITCMPKTQMENPVYIGLGTLKEIHGDNDFQL